MYLAGCLVYPQGRMTPDSNRNPSQSRRCGSGVRSARASFCCKPRAKSEGGRSEKEVQFRVGRSEVGFQRHPCDPKSWAIAGEKWRLLCEFYFK